MIARAALQAPQGLEPPILIGVAWCKNGAIRLVQLMVEP